MPLRAWRCPQCTRRTFTTSARHHAVGPEHPQYLEIPEPPQQDAPDLPPVKGILPVPRNVLSGAQGRDRASDEEIAKATKLPARETVVQPGSREEWRRKMSDSRRQNLRDGLKGLRARQQSERKDIEKRNRRHQEEIAEARARPEPADERLTATSNALDLDTLLHSPVLEDPTRELRLEHGRANVALQAQRKQSARADHLHALYIHARHFIVSPQQLDAAVDEAFGTPDKLVSFGKYVGAFGAGGSEQSVWAEGKPLNVADMLAQAGGVTGGRGGAMESVSGYSQVTTERMRRLAEGLTGGKMERGSRS